MRIWECITFSNPAICYSGLLSRDISYMEWWAGGHLFSLNSELRDYSYVKFMFMKHIIVKYSINGLHNVKK